MNIFLDLISPIPEFTVFDDNKIILSRTITKSKEDRLSEVIIPTFLDIDKKLNLLKKIKSLLLTSGPGSYTTLRVGISFFLGLHFTKNVKLAQISVADLLKFKLVNEKKLNRGIYIISGNKQKFICYNFNLNFHYIKLEDQKFETFEELKEIDIMYYNHKPLKLFNLQFVNEKYDVKQSVIKNFSSINFKSSEIIKALYIN